VFDILMNTLLPRPVSDQQFENACLMKIVNRHLQVEDINNFKHNPGFDKWFREPVAVEAVGATIIAANGWDISGVEDVSLRPLFGVSHEKVRYPLAEKRDRVVRDQGAFRAAWRPIQNRRWATFRQSLSL